MTRVSKEGRVHRFGAGAGILCLCLLSLVSLPAKARGASAFVMPDPASPLYRSFIAAAGSRLQVEKDCRLTGNVHSNANADLDTGDLVTGNVSAVGRVDDRGTVTGTVTSGAPARTLPQLPTEAQARALANRVFERDTTFKNAKIDDVVFVAGDAHIEGSLNGTGTIIARGDVLLDDVDPNQPITLAPTSRLSLLAFHDLHVGKARPFRGLLLAGHDSRLGAKANLEGVLVTLHQLHVEHDSHLAFLELDVTPPSISNLAPAGGSLLANATPTIAAAFADDLSGVDPASVHFLLDGTDRTAAAHVTAAGITFTPSTPLPDGSHAAAVSVRDLAGNLAQATWSFTTDVTPPALAFTAPSVTITVPRPPIAVAYGDATSGIDPTSLRIALDAADITPSCTVGASSASCSSPTLAPGGHSLAAAIRDRAGNSATASLAFSVVLDTGPVISALIPAAGSFLPTALPTLTAVFSDPGAAIDPASFRLVLDGGDQTAAAQVTAAGFSFTPVSPLAEGAHGAAVQIGNQLGQVAHAQTGFTVDTVAPNLTITAPDAANDASLRQVTVAYDDATSGIDLTTLHITLDGADLTAGCTVQAASSTCAPQPQPEGLHVVSALVKDRAGNGAAANLTYTVVFAPPTVTLMAPADGSLVSSPSQAVSGTVGGPKPVVTVNVNGSPAALAGGQFQATVVLTEGINVLLASALDSSGKEGTATATVTLDTQPPSLSIDPPAVKLTNQPTVRISGQASDANGIAAVTLNGLAAPVQAGAFAADVPVAEGASVVTVQATDLAGNRTVASVAVQRFTLPAVTISSPADLSFIAATTVTVSGTVSDPSVTVTVNGVAAGLSGASFVAGGVPLLEGGNIITATAATPSGAIGTASVDVVRDLTPPRLSIDHPADGTILFDPAVTVSGLVNDILPGTVNAADVSVTVNGVPAAVANRSFILPGVALSPGDNTLTALATDAAGNVGKAAITVHLLAPTAARVALVSGDHQQATIGQALPLPLVVAVLDAGGSPVPGKNVLFQVRGGSGTLDGGGRGVVAVTDAAGRAQAHFTLGDRAGAGGQVVEASSPGFAGPATFIATGLPGAPALLVVDSGDQQVGIAGQQLPRPLVAVVTDGGFNRLEGVQVTFTVVKGMGHFVNGQQALTALSDSNGRAIVKLTLDAAAGVAGNVARASLGAVPGAARVAFTATGRVAGDPAATSVSGVVLDNAGQPVSGVTLRLFNNQQTDTLLTARSDARGLFRISGAPVGTLKLLVDGSTADRPGPWPGLEYTLTTIPGQDNTVNMPIYLLPLDLQHGLSVDETHGGRLILADLPGFALDIAPGSVIFPDGTRSGLVSVTVVHNDKVPMVPNFGQQPLLIVTIQPAGARFDPPARFTLPNVEGLKAGEVTEMYSFDHDLGTFVSIGPATVSDDGSVIASNPGVGIVKAGWHCSGFPSLFGAFDLCRQCQKCDGSGCVPDDTRTCQLFPQDPCDIGDSCFLGACLPTFVKIDSITGLCSATVNSQTNFTAQSNAPDKINWTGDPDGIPPTAMGGTYLVAFPSPGPKVVVAKCKPALQYKTIRVSPSCDHLTSPSAPQTFRVAGVVPPNGFGFTDAAEDVEFLTASCGRGSQICLSLTRLEIGHGFGIDGGLDSDILGSADPQITATNCADVIADFTPYDPSKGPPRTKYWSSKITMDHELVHETRQLPDQVDDPLFNEIVALVNNTCADCQAPDQASLRPQIMALQKKYQKIWDDNRPEDELRAHAQSNPEYLALIAGIRARAAAEQWPAECQ
jgi:glucodextranase-like protein/carboxypeptidase family protein/Big-like domain-containing protein